MQVVKYIPVSHHNKKAGVKMNWLICSAALCLFVILFPAVCLAVDKSSSSYKAGQIFAFLVLVTIIYLVIKKMKNKK